MIKKLKNIIYKVRYTNEKIKSELNFGNQINKLTEQKNSFFHGNNKIHNCTIGKNSYVSYNSIVYNCNIGNYCSIGPNVVVGFGDHPQSLITTNPFVYLNNDILTQAEIDSILKNHFLLVNIKNDVWIGANVYIKNGVSIGNGAIIGAGAVVTKDVKDYEIVAGVPAKVLKKRFNDNIINLLLKVKWWELELGELKKFKDVILNPSEENLNLMLKDLQNVSNIK